MVECRVPVGYRFHPTDEELVSHYLNLKLLGHHSTVIAEVDVCKFEPWDLPAFSKVKSDDPEWFFFSPVGLKYRNSSRCNRATDAGYWKTTGKERKIKTRGTNNVIGTKKTLVFYKGRVPQGVKTSWVIHEYHAVTFPDDKRNFVLCRLMEKSEKKAEGGTAALIHDEEEPSNHIATNYESQAITAHRRIPDAYTSPEVNLESVYLPQLQVEDYDIPSLQQSPVAIEQEPCFQGSTSPNALFGNENSIMQFPFETMQGEDDVDLFLNSILAGEDVFTDEEAAHAFINESTPSQNLGELYYESSEKDAELLPPQHGHILDTTSTLCNDPTVSRENQLISVVRSSHDAVYDGHPALSASYDFRGADDSVDSTAKSLSIFLIENASYPSSQAVSQQEDLRLSELQGPSQQVLKESTINHSTGITEKGFFHLHWDFFAANFRVSFNLEFFAS